MEYQWKWPDDPGSSTITFKMTLPMYREVMTLKAFCQMIPIPEIEVSYREFTVIAHINMLHDLALYNANLDTVKTPNFTEEEVADWQKYDKMLGDPKWWKKARERVEIERDQNLISNSK